MNAYVGLLDDRRDGERLAARIGLLFTGTSATWLQRDERLRRQHASAGLGVRRGWPASTGAG
ncbi:hypothetical protein DN516_30870 [Burkholderia multivorans]|uniref:hypothetical protein n=1 Tax=Burkholderia multivorans TaxID=87883 RepID=UPI000DAC55A4|nr:hypothetical protein [Burkholderia multivorans]RAF17761.1 hypothetical protein DN516_30870 [Burkholderia multivorans]